MNGRGPQVLGIENIVQSEVLAVAQLMREISDDVGL
jgi:hypothetical protein